MIYIYIIGEDVSDGRGRGIEAGPEADLETVVRGTARGTPARAPWKVSYLGLVLLPEIKGHHLHWPTPTFSCVFLDAGMDRVHSGFK